MKFAVITFPGSNCDQDAYHAARDVLGEQAEYIWHKDADLKGADVSEGTLSQLLAVDSDQWRKEMASIGEYFAEFGDRLPAELKAEHEKVVRELG